eukprot:gene54519-36232_t
MLLADGVDLFLRLAGSAACLYRRPLASTARGPFPREL